MSGLKGADVTAIALHLIGGTPIVPGASRQRAPGAGPRWRRAWRKPAAVLMAAIPVVGCASRPERIAPAPVSEAPYLDWTCPRIAEESRRLSDALAAASAKQQKASDDDALGVFLLGLPVASMSGGDIGPDVARLKGETEAVQRAATKNNCGETAPGPGASAAAAPSQAAPDTAAGSERSGSPAVGSQRIESTELTGKSP